MPSPKPSTRRRVSTRSTSKSSRGSRDTTSSPPSMPAAEYASRRERVLAELKSKQKGAVALLFAGDARGEDPYRPHPHFEYLTGIDDEPGAMLLLDPNEPVASRRAVLFLRPLDPEVERWDGLREGIGSSLRTRYGIATIMRHRYLGRTLSTATVRAKRLCCLHPPAHFDHPLSPDLDLFRKLAERIPGTEIVADADLLPRMRAAKSPAEVAMIRHAASITRAGFLAAMRSIRAGLDEYQVESTLDGAYRAGNSRRHAFRPIVGAGINATVLHYHGNCEPLESGDLVLIDSGAEFGGYASDVTRTLPIDGRFTKRQREIYEIVLKALDAGIKACRPGKRLSDVDAAARKVVTAAGYGDCFPHGTGHHLGLEVHDATPDEPLRVGAVLTVEPGIYLPDERIGIRIEDDIEVTAKGPRNLTRDVPRTVAEIERAMGR
ncbi:MAG: aminopeptidase P N-terminal domain-containing protein [Phycisphaerales bacterium]